VSITPRGRKPADQKARAPISARWLNQVKDAAYGDADAGPGLVETSIGGVKVMRAASSLGVVRVQIPAGGINSNSSAACQYYTMDHALSGSGKTIDVYNRTGATVGGTNAKIGYAVYVAAEAEIQVVQEVCA
jgi:hypothetical protein